MEGIESSDPSSSADSQAGSPADSSTGQRPLVKMPTLEEISKFIDTGIKQLNKGVPAYKAIRYFFVTQGELIKTTTLKIKRPAEMEKIRQLLAGQGLEMRKANGRIM
jgi:long-chain acyl-CoA synthetase